jgi:hypothetical protein
MKKKSIIQPTKIEHIPLHCPICKDRFMNLFGQPLPNHAQIRCHTLTGDEMDIGICENCIERGVSLDMCRAVLEGIKDFWKIEIDINKNLSEEDKEHKREIHNSHQIEKFTEIRKTGKEAEEQARKDGKLK